MRDLSRIDLATMMRVSRSSVGQWETGVVTPTLANLNRISDLTEIPLAWFLTDPAPHVDVSQSVDIIEKLPPLVRQAVLRDLKNAARYARNLPAWAAAITLPLTDEDLANVTSKITEEMRLMSHE